MEYIGGHVGFIRQSHGYLAAVCSLEGVVHVAESHVGTCCDDEAGSTMQDLLSWLCSCKQ